MKRWAIFALGLALSCLFLFLAFRKVSFEELGAIITQVRWSWVFAAAVVMLADWLLMGVRWRVLLSREQPLPFGTVFSVLCFGMFANNVLPARAGEVFRAYVLGKREGLSKSFCLGTIVIERVSDLVALLSLVFLGGMFIELPAWAAGMSELAGGLVVVVLLGFVLILVGGRQVSGFLTQVERLMPSRRKGFLVEKFNAFQVAIHAVTDWRLVPLLIVLAWGVWTLNAASAYLALRSLGGDVSFLGMLFAIGAVNIGIAIPSSPGFLGTYQWLFVHALAALGVAEPLGLAVSLLFHAVWYLPSTAMGFVVALRYGLLGGGQLREAQTP